MSESERWLPVEEMSMKIVDPYSPEGRRPLTEAELREYEDRAIAARRVINPGEFDWPSVMIRMVLEIERLRSGDKQA